MSDKKIVFICHPISGDPEGNVQKILQIIRHINLTELDVIPFCPYLAEAIIMEDHNPAERKRAIDNGHAVIKATKISECRLYGDRISPGMAAEKHLFENIGVPVVSYIIPEQRPVPCNTCFGTGQSVSENILKPLLCMTCGGSGYAP